MAHPGDMRIDDLWARLLADLDTWASAREVEGGIEVTFEQATGVARTVEIVATPGDWGEYAGVVWGAVGPALAELRSVLLAMPTDTGYLVYTDSYDFEPSPTRVPLPGPDADFLPEPGGQWVALDSDGRVTSRFADWIRN